MWIDEKELNEMIAFAERYGIDYDVFYGNLQDNFIFYTCNPKNSTDEKYVIVKEIALNEWSSGLQVILTNSDQEAVQFIKTYSNEDYEESA